MIMLGIETSCDETAAALVEDGRKVLSNVVASQIEEHKIYGGVVPEIASRRHSEAISAVVGEALAQSGRSLSDVSAIAATCAPGLIGALLVGVNFAKGLALSAGLPLVPVHHLRGHIAANYLCHPNLEPPFLCLVASGGHSHIVMVHGYTRLEVLARTRDDAAGEAFDKAARAMGFSYPGGVFLDRAAQQGNPAAYSLPRPRVEGSPYDFSFSGLKTAVVNLLHNAAQKGETIRTNDLAASFQQAAVELLTSRFERAAQELGYQKLVVAGGVSANSGLRHAMEDICQKRGWQLYQPPLSLCGDNGAMIGAQGYYEFLAGHTAGMDLNGIASLPVDA